MEKIKLNVKEREIKTPNQLRREAKIPGTLYGPGELSKNIQIDEREFSRLPAAAFSHVIELDLANGKPTSVLVRHVHRQSFTDKVLNVEFYRVRLDQKITVTVPLKFIGIAEAVTLKGGQLIQAHDEAEIECLPNDIPDYLEVDLTSLVEIDDAIHFSDLKVSERVKILNPLDEVVAKAAEIREVIEEVVTPAEEVVAEGEAAAEGAAAGTPAAAGEQPATPGAKGAGAPAAKGSGAPASKGPAAPAAKGKDKEK